MLKRSPGRIGASEVQSLDARTSALDSPFGRDMLAALSTRPRSISPKYFYDERGSELFDRICELPEYYPTRCPEPGNRAGSSRRCV